MSTYNITYSDPLRDGFTIAPGGFNGPGGALVASALRLYGRGALEWGEAVNENMLRALEQFNGATPPPFPLAGQIWFNTKFYWHDTSGTPFWYRLDPNVPGTWQSAPTNFLVNSGSGNVASNTQPAQVIGDYWWTGAGPFTPSTDAFGEPVLADTLYRYDSAFAQMAPGWIPRTNSVSTIAPVDGVDYPERGLLCWDEFLQAWVSPPVSFVSASTNPPPNPATGAFWWETDTEQLNVWDGTAWVGLILSSGTQAWVGPNNFDMGGFRITNMANPVGAQDAATKSYVDGLAAPAALNLVYRRLDGGNTPTAALPMGGFNLTGLPLQTYPLANANNAATITYVNGLAAAIGTPLSGGFASIGSGGGVVSHKPGDIYVNPATSHAWVAMTTASSAPTFYGSSGSDANWKQFFPAQWA